VTPSGGSTPYIATYNFATIDFPNTGSTDKIYYVYAILSNDVSGACRPVQEIKVTVHPLPAFTLATTNISCFGTTDGTIIVTATGATPFTYSKDNGTTFQNGNTFNNLPAATYNVHVKDTNGCVRKCQ
jgi:SprB repeat